MKKSTNKSIQNRNIEQEINESSSLESESNIDSLDDLELDKISSNLKYLDSSLFLTFHIH